MSSETTIYFGRFAKALWMLSMVVFLVSLLYIYTKLPPFIALTSDISAFNFLNFPKSDFFYGVLIIFIISNLAWYLIAKRLSGFSNFKSNGNTFMTNDKIHNLINWLNSFSFIINCLIIVSIFFIWVSISETKNGINLLSTGIYSFLGLIVFWLLLLGYLIVKKEKSETALEV